ncbi:MAG: hypothetical protein ACLQPD_33925 [Desulfomonilaceae bacterium]
MPKRHRNAKEISHDICSGMNDAALMETYQLSVQGAPEGIQADSLIKRGQKA